MQMTRRFHAILDYIAVGVFAVAPTAIGFSGEAAALCYGFAVLHLLLTIATEFPGGVLRLVPFSLHGKVELAAGVALVVPPRLLGFATIPSTFLVLMGVGLLVLWAFTPYAKTPRHRTSSRWPSATSTR